MAKTERVTAYRRIAQRSCQLLPNSRLYHLNPIGVGTSEVECLTGYIGRLAQEHLVTPYILILNEVVPLLKEYQSLVSRSQFNLFHRPVNGTGRTATIFVNVIQELTKRSDLHFLTLLHWSEVLSSYSLIRAFRAWCPICYEEQRLNSKTCYDPLLWVLELINVCPKHEKFLVTACPHCETNLLHLGARSRPGYCSKCSGYLGEKIKQGNANISSSLNPETEWELWKSKAVGELLATSSQCLQPKRSNIAKSLDVCVQTYAWGRISELSGQVSITYQNLRSWIKGDSLPSLGTILGMCFKLGISPLRFLRGSLEEKEISPNVRSGGQIKDKSPKSSPQSSFKLSEREVERELHKATTTFPPPSIKDLMEKTGWGRKRLKKWFPELFIKITTMHSAFYSKRIELLSSEKILRLALTETPPPSLNQLAKRIGCRNAGTLQYHFPDLTKAIVERYKKHWYKQVNWKDVKDELRKALKENPPQSLQKVTRRLNLCEPPYDKFSDLCKAISKRYVNYVKDKGIERRNLKRQTIQKAITKISLKGLHPSRQRVSQLLGININPVEFTEANSALKKT